MRRAAHPDVPSTIDLSVADVSLSDLMPRGISLPEIAVPPRGALPIDIESLSFRSAPSPVPTLRISFSELRGISFPKMLPPVHVRPARPPLSTAAAALLAPPAAGTTMPWAVEEHARRRRGSGWLIALCTMLTFGISTLVVSNSRLADDPAVRPYAEAAGRTADRAWLEARKHVANAIAAARAAAP